MVDKQTLKELQIYIDKNLKIAVLEKMGEAELFSSSEKEIVIDELENFIKDKRQKTFAEVLFEFIDEKKLKDSDVYKKAGIDRRHFSKIRSNSGYNTSKSTAVALAISLQLNKKETKKLLSSAGFSLSESNTFDLVIQFCLEKKIYHIDEVNQALHYFGLKAL